LPFAWYIPLVILTLGNLWNGFLYQSAPLDGVLYTVKMLGVGFLEELIFRSFLFWAMKKESVKWAVIVSSLTFDMGHIVNLLNGSGMDLTENLVQIVCAAAIGFAYVMVFLRSGSLWPCVLSHGIFNSLSQFERPGAPVAELVVRGGLCLLAIGYGIALHKSKKTV
jgi:membrane protease YdiL (CAAX protease family)